MIVMAIHPACDCPGGAGHARIFTGWRVPSGARLPEGCAGWSAADVAGHVIGDLRATEAMAAGRYEEIEAGDPGSAAGDDPLAAWRVARADMMAALDPAALAPNAPRPGTPTISPGCLAIFGRPRDPAKFLEVRP